jgi:hypothetical protein
MDTMRRFLVTLTALGLLSTVFGCHHVAGVCDCADVDHFYGPCAHHCGIEGHGPISDVITTSHQEPPSGGNGGHGF